MILWYERQIFLKLQVLRDYEFNVWDGKIVLTVKKACEICWGTYVNASKHKDPLATLCELLGITDQLDSLWAS